MSTEAIANYVRRLILADDSLTDQGNCRHSVEVLSQAVGEKFPAATVTTLAYPDARTGDGVHHAFAVEEGNSQLLVNPVAAPGFPQYIGASSKAVPTFQAMKHVPGVK